MFLSKLILNHRNRDVRRDLADCHNLHRSVMSAFPHLNSPSARDELAVLHRLEVNLRSGALVVFVQSAAEPDWNQLPSGYLLEAEDNPACKPINGSYSALRDGQQLAFRLRANPTKKVAAFDAEGNKKKNGTRAELHGEQKQTEWLVRKSAQHGFQLLRLRISQDQTAARQMFEMTEPSDLPTVAPANVRANPAIKICGWRGEANRRAEKDRLTFGAVIFEGLLEITDADKFKQALANGIGSGKAYGFGLLSVAPAGARMSASAG